MKIMTVACAVSILLLAGCGAEPSSPRAAAGSAPAGAASGPVPPSAAGSGSAPAADGSACELPVAFEVADGWTTKAIDVWQIDDKLLAGMFRTGPFETICSVNGKPAGVDGFVRVYFTDASAGSPRDNLKVYVTMDTLGARDTVEYEARDAEYRDVTIGGVPAAEVTWNRRSLAGKPTNKYSAFALNTPKGAVVVVLMPFTTKDYADVRPTYDLAKKTLTVNP